MEPEKTYIAIDLKSFYASVECVERHFDPLTTNLVVADESRTEKTICLAVSPSLKAYGIPGRARLFEVIQRVKEVNARRLREGIRSGCIRKDGEHMGGTAQYPLSFPHHARYPQETLQALYQCRIRNSSLRSFPCPEYRKTL